MLKIAGLADKAAQWIAISFLALMTGMVFLNAALRYLFNSSIVVSEEVSRYLFVWMSFLGAILAFAEGSHVRVDFAVNRFPPPLRKAANLLMDVLMLVCCVLMAHGGWRQTVINMENPAAVSEIPMGVVYLPSLVASVAIGCLIIAKAARRLGGREEGANP